MIDFYLCRLGYIIQKHEVLCQQAPTILHDLINHIRALQQTNSRDIDPVLYTPITSLVKAPSILVYNTYNAFRS
jgi:hypothetical protein